jgi:hypothetical protein
VKGKTKQHWMALCEQAAVEQDSEKLLELIHEIDRMPDDKEQRLSTSSTSIKSLPYRATPERP